MWFRGSTSVAAMLSALALFSVRLPAQDPPAGAPIAATGLPETAPLKLTADATAAALTIRLQIEPGWHLYGRDTGGGQPVRVVCLPDSAFAAAGPLRVPMDQQGKITGKAELVLPLRAAAGGTELRARLQFMVCDALQCLPPIEVTLNGVPGAAKPALAVLLVAVAVDARADRIAAFLKDRGCQPTVTTWNTVSAAECDGADVVLADSPLFGKTKPANVANFPVTKSPVVTVGFLGTELLKAQKVTMASGYI